MSNAVAFANAKLPSVANLADALRNVQNTVGSSDNILLKMDKTGHWVFGADQTEIEEGSEWAVNPFSFIHGYIAWGEGEILGEKVVPVSQPLPELDAAPAGAKRGWEVQIGCALKCVSGEDNGMDVRYAVTSLGGKKAVQKLALDIAAQVEKDQTKPVPIVRLGKDHYQHKSYGRVFTPVFEIVRWVGMDGPTATASEGEASKAPEAAAPAEEPQRRRRRSA